jgi:photosystem II stability/assembly factor-like uncharacterized protein
VSGLGLEKVFFVNPNIGYAIGWGGTILSTKDGGRIWVQNRSGVEYWLPGISFINADTGWVVGSDLQTRRRGVVLHTKDGGQSWQKQFETYSPSIFSSQLFSDVAFLNAREGWAFAGDFVDNFSPTNVYKTVNGGESWAVVGQAGGPLYEMSVVSSDTIWGGGFPFSISTNGGVYWKHKLWPLDYAGLVVDVEQIDGQTGWLAAVFVTNTRKTGSRILFTKDGGVTFSETFVDSSGQVIFRAMERHEEFFWAVGYFGAILHHKERPNRVDTPGNEIPRMLRVEQNYPNPFNSRTTIDFVLSKKQHITITVYDLVGKEVAVLLSQTLSPGAHSVIWDGTDKLRGLRAASGIYFYELRSSGLLLRKKMMVVN